MMVTSGCLSLPPQAPTLRVSWAECAWGHTFSVQSAAPPERFCLAGESLEEERSPHLSHSCLEESTCIMDLGSGMRNASGLPLLGKCYSASLGAAEEREPCMVWNFPEYSSVIRHWGWELNGQMPLFLKKFNTLG